MDRKTTENILLQNKASIFDLENDNHRLLEII